jgi:DNA-binding NarL/FixJ family response regulator
LSDCSNDSATQGFDWRSDTGDQKNPSRVNGKIMPDTTGSDTPRVLIVEDDYLVASLAEAALIDSGFTVIGIADTVADALKLAAAERPEIVIMDIRLKGQRDGIEGAKELLAAYGSRCIYATAHHDSDTRRRAEATAPLGWLPKPYTTNALVAMTCRAAQEIRRLAR